MRSHMKRDEPLHAMIMGHLKKKRMEIIDWIILGGWYI